jgi:hypothetical protein
MTGLGCRHAVQGEQRKWIVQLDRALATKTYDERTAREIETAAASSRTPARIVGSGVLA